MTARFDSQAQLSALLLLVSAGSAVVSLALAGGDSTFEGSDRTMAAVCAGLAPFFLVWFLVRLRRIRQVFVAGTDVAGVVVEVGAGLSDRRRIVFDYELDGRRFRRKYHLSERLLSG